MRSNRILLPDTGRRIFCGLLDWWSTLDLPFFITWIVLTGHARIALFLRDNIGERDPIARVGAEESAYIR